MQCKIVQCEIVQFENVKCEIVQCEIVRFENVLYEIVQCENGDCAVVRPQSGQSACRVTAQQTHALNIEEHRETLRDIEGYRWTLIFFNKISCS